MSLPQRRLVFELKVAIDRADRTGRQQDIDYAIRLASTNVSAMRTKYVRHNIGKARLIWLAGYVAEVNP